MKTVHISLLLALALLLSLPALARDWYVSANGTGDGLTAGSPTQNLSAVLGSAATDDALYLNGGDGFGYAPNVLIAAVKLTLQSYGTGQAIISNTATADNQYLFTVTAGGSGSTFDNVQFWFNDLGNGPYPYGTLHLANLASNVSIRNCTFRHVDSPGAWAWQGISFITMNDSKHANVVIANNVFRDLRFDTQYNYRHYIIQAIGANDLLVVNNTVSNYEGFLYFNWGDPNSSARVKVLSNKLYRCYGSISYGDNKFAGGLVRNDYKGLASGEFAWNIIYNGFPDMTNNTQYAACFVFRGFNDGKIHNNTFYGLGAACLINSANEPVANMEWYNNILVACNANAMFGFYSSVANGIWSGIVYSNIWDPFQNFSNQYYGGANVYVPDNPLLDPLFSSLDPGNSAFLRPTAPAAAYGLGGGFIGAVNPVPEPLLFAASLGIVALMLTRKR